MGRELGDQGGCRLEENARVVDEGEEPGMRTLRRSEGLLSRIERDRQYTFRPLCLNKDPAPQIV